MDVILLERVEKLGQLGQVVKVKPGYARNYLLPKKKALRATKQNLAYFEDQKAQIEARNLELKKEAEVVAKKVDGVSVVVVRQAAESGVLYGSVTSRDIAEAVTATGTTISRAQVAIADPIKTLGLFKVKVVLHPEVAVSVTVNVARSVEEAAVQAARGGMVTSRDEDQDEDETVEETEATEETEA
jgi:large subunit ribosomal protein L9